MKEHLSVQTIPADFYAGKNPVVTFKAVSKEIDLNKFAPGQNLSARHKAALDKTTAAGSGAKLHPVHLLTSRKSLLIIFGIVFVLGVAGATVYYLKTAPQAVLAPPPAPAVEAPKPPPIPEEPAPIVATTTEAVPTTPAQPKSLGGGSLELPSLFLADSADSDSDGLTDVEEELFGTDPALPDTDGDKYSDSHEVYNVYNPAGKEPEKIIDSGAVKDFDNPVFGYKIYYSRPWALGVVDDTYRDVLFSTITGENIEVRVVDKAPGANFADWFAAWAPSEQFNDLIPFTSVFKQAGWRRSDYLVYYFDDGSRVYVIAYHTTDSSVVNYRTVIKMVARSFRLNGNSAVIPTRPVEVGTAASTSASTTAL